MDIFCSHPACTAHVICRVRSSCSIRQWPKNFALLWQRERRGMSEPIDLVIAPALGGMIVAHEVARALGVRALFTERQEGKMRLRRGFEIEGGERAFVVEDVITTGGSTREVMEVVEQYGGMIAGVGSLIDRSGGEVDLGVPRYTLAVLAAPVYKPEECPLCEEGSTAIKPGSRQGRFEI
jgi:orotate phosphoribosyltransferase